MIERQKNILLVEDNPIASMSAKFILENMGCHVDCVEDGQDAVEQFLQKKYDAICMDIGLPTMSGVDACIAIREYEKKNHLDPVPIVAVTANNSTEDAEKYLTVGMQAVIAKPLTQDNADYFLSFCK